MMYKIVEATDSGYYVMRDAGPGALNLPACACTTLDEALAFVKKALTYTLQSPPWAPGNPPPPL